MIIFSLFLVLASFIMDSNSKRDEEAKEIKDKTDAALQTVIGIFSSIACQTEITECCNVTCQTDSDLQGIEDAITVSNGLDDSYLRELEERCSEYQTDLYQLRAELMTLQADIDQSEEAKAKLSEDILSLLYSSFIIDGQPALPKLKPTGYESSVEAEQVILSALRQLASIWKGLLDKKGTLERTVAKLSTQSKCKTPEDQVDLGINLSHTSNAVATASATLIPTIDFFPPKVDSFGLETIIEEERAEDDSRSTEADRDTEGLLEEPLSIIEAHSTTSTIKTNTTENSAPNKTLSSSSNIKEACNNGTQTEPEPLETKTSEEELRAQIFATLEAPWLEKEKDWISKVEEKESRIKKLQADLQRLQNHLVDLEDQYTNDALICEEREKQLRLQIAELQNQISQTIQETNENGGVRDEIVRLTAERDFARTANVSFEEQLQKLGTQLQNLHFVLEQFQKEKEFEIGEVQRAMKQEMQAMEIQSKHLRKELETERGLLARARSGLEAAEHLNSQIEDKSRLVTQLRNQVQEKESEVERLSKQLEELNNNNVAKIDRYLIKNLIVGYFTTPTDKRTEVLRIIATVLDFNREDRQRTGLESTSIWPFGRGGSDSTESARQQSFSTAFIKFLETESQPKTPIQIPLDEITRRNSRSSTSSTPVPGAAGDGHTRHSSTSSMSEMSVNLPVLNQADRSNSILKDVLNPRS
ncbi:unnamed protein product [Orchesella dallaii]|uniref:GRIP domain-containing protein n=1 Tax=Orchesella dallaii TaxID=48710 RepID=A0ABP1QDW2_9HEXA